jgi:hypothetical protein
LSTRLSPFAGCPRGGIVPGRSDFAVWWVLRDPSGNLGTD